MSVKAIVIDLRGLSLIDREAPALARVNQYNLQLYSVLTYDTLTEVYCREKKFFTEYVSKI